MKIAIRLDDITPDMDWNAFYRVKALLDRAGIQPLIGIVPDHQDNNLHREETREDFWDQMRTLQQAGWSVALHGMHHVYSTKKGGLFPLNHFSEYAGISYAKQLEMLRKGKDILESHGVQIDCFMAPGHSYDKNTLKALKEVGILSVTDGFGEKPYRYKEITFYPISFRMEKTLQKTQGYSTLVLHANTMKEQDFVLLERRLFPDEEHRHVSEFISFSEYRKVIAEERGMMDHIKEWSMATCKWLLVKVKTLIAK